MPDEDKNPKTENSQETHTLHEPVVLFDGRCEHEWVEHAEPDAEGYRRASCRKCPMGVRYREAHRPAYIVVS